MRSASAARFQNVTILLAEQREKVVFLVQRSLNESMQALLSTLVAVLLLGHRIVEIMLNIFIGRMIGRLACPFISRE